MKQITYNDIVKWGPCYSPDRFIPETWRGTVLDILDLKEVSFPDKLWVIARQELVSEKLMRLFAVWSARQVQHLIGDQRISTALDVAERFANGKATKEELSAAWYAARAAARAAATDAAWDAARAAARAAATDAAWDAAEDAAWYAARGAAWYAARSAAWYAARAAARAAATDAAEDAAWYAQENKLREMVTAGIKTGDVY